MAKFYSISGKQQNSHMQEVTLQSNGTPVDTQRHVAKIFDAMQVIDRIDRNLTPESKKELYLYVPVPSLTQNSNYLLFA